MRHVLENPSSTVVLCAEKSDQRKYGQFTDASWWQAFAFTY